MYDLVLILARELLRLVLNTILEFFYTQQLSFLRFVFWGFCGLWAQSVFSGFLRRDRRYISMGMDKRELGSLRIQFYAYILAFLGAIR